MLTDEELAAIKARWDEILLPSGIEAMTDVRALLAEVERLREREAALMERVDELEQLLREFSL